MKCTIAHGGGSDEGAASGDGALAECHLGEGLALGGGLARRRGRERRGYVRTEALSANMAMIVEELTGCCS